MVKYYFPITKKTEDKKEKKAPKTQSGLTQQIKKVVMGISETKHHEYYHTDTFYGYGGSLVLNMFDPTNASAAAVTVVGNEAYLDKTLIKLNFTRNTGVVAVRIRAILFYWYDVSNVPIYSDILKTPTINTEYDQFVLSNPAWTAKKRYSILADKMILIDSDKLRGTMKIKVDHKKRKVTYEEGTQYNPSLYLLLFNSMTSSYPSTVNMVARTSYKDV